MLDEMIHRQRLLHAEAEHLTLERKRTVNGVIRAMQSDERGMDRVGPWGAKRFDDFAGRAHMIEVRVRVKKVFDPEGSPQRRLHALNPCEDPTGFVPGIDQECFTGPGTGEQPAVASERSDDQGFIQQGSLHEVASLPYPGPSGQNLVFNRGISIRSLKAFTCQTLLQPRSFRHPKELSLLFPFLLAFIPSLAPAEASELVLETTQGAFPPLRNRVSIRCDGSPTPDTCQALWEKMSPEQPFSRIAEEVGVFRATLSKAKAADFLRQAALIVAAAPKPDATIPHDATNYRISLAPGSEPLSKPVRLPDDETAPPVPSFLALTRSIRDLAAEHPLRTARLDCRGERNGPLIQFRCEIHNTGSERIPVPPFGASQIRVYAKGQDYRQSITEIRGGNHRTPVLLAAGAMHFVQVTLDLGAQPKPIQAFHVFIDLARPGKDGWEPLLSSATVEVR